MGEKIIADALDTALARHYEQLGNTEREKVAVVFMDGRWVAIKADFTPDEIREAVEYIKHRRLTKEFGKALAELSPFAIKDGQVFIKDAFIGSGIVSANYNVKLNDADKGKPHEAGMTLGIEGDQSKVEFLADRYKVHEAASSTLGSAIVTNPKVNIRLGDETKQAVIDAVRESDLFAAIQASINAQEASVAGLQQAMRDLVNDAIRNALKPGGAIWAQLGS
ncbi:phage tail tip fiber protein [Enterobacter hormaechei]|uniref:phage tail tip fiber protein n=1 Tax=Enterobacter hormaechei TaxID=158836 RepID=UPI002874F1F6|nr:DUF1983 domain-containing protein [Enterobacter hormaechei]MDS0956428.1 DUF1983 domain-containing protein [Enterobacter hormaechei]MDS0987559.1 DUF1983 domain-containing protein [Enterobacter hormaechei]